MNKSALVFKDDSKFMIIDHKNHILYNRFGAMLYEMLGMDRKEFIKHIKDELFGGIEYYLFGDERHKEKLFNEPIILFEYIGMVNDFKNREFYNVYKRTYNPNLQELGIYIDPDIVWKSLVEFLSRKRSEKEVMPEILNYIKIEKHSFDLKTSFRTKMKKKK